jgi:Response regulator
MIMQGAFGEVSLTPRERQTLCLVIKGKTTAAVAALLGISPRTAELYLASVKRKLGCRTKSEMVHYLLKSGMMAQLEAD